MRDDAHIELRIDHLLLEGVAPGDRQRFVSTLRSELEQRAVRARPGELGAEGQSRKLSGSPLEVANGLGAEALGKRVAEHIWNCCREGGQ